MGKWRPAAEDDGLMASPVQWTLNLSKLGDDGGQGKPGVPEVMDRKELDKI